MGHVRKNNSHGGGRQGIFFRKEESSFCEQKEAKKLHWTDDGNASFPWMRVGGDPEERGLSGWQMKKVFWFFFSKKNVLSSRLPLPAPRGRLPAG
jgi:hypothetical protein